MPNHIEYDPGVPTFKHSDKFESRAMVKMMQKEATLAERAWEERTSQRDNNKGLYGFKDLDLSHFYLEQLLTVKFTTKNFQNMKSVVSLNHVC